MHAGLRGYVLAGGESSRMQGHGLPPDKASLVWEGRTLLERAINLLQSVCDAPQILCGTRERCARFQLRDGGIVDRFSGMGPMGGLEAALADAKRHCASWVLIIPVDLPYLTSDLLAAFVTSALALRASVCCLRGAERTQPLPALIHVDALPLVQELLLAGHRKVLLVFSSVGLSLTPETGLTVIEAAGLSGVGDTSRWFWNVNTPEEFGLLQEAETHKTLLHQSTHDQ